MKNLLNLGAPLSSKQQKETLGGQIPPKGECRNPNAPDCDHCDYEGFAYPPLVHPECTIHN